MGLTVLVLLLHKAAIFACNYFLNALKNNIGEEIERAYETMKRNFLYLIFSAVGVAIMILGLPFYRSRQKSSGIEINIDNNGIFIQRN